MFRNHILINTKKACMYLFLYSTCLKLSLYYTFQTKAICISIYLLFGLLTRFSFAIFSQSSISIPFSGILQYHNIGAFSLSAVSIFFHFKFNFIYETEKKKIPLSTHRLFLNDRCIILFNRFFQHPELAPVLKNRLVLYCIL